LILTVRVQARQPAPKGEEPNGKSHPSQTG
jgi:hypothetical protein